MPTDLVSFRAAGWLAAPEGESRASTTALIETLVSERTRMRTAITEVLAHVESPDLERVGNQCTLCFTYRAKLRDALTALTVSKEQP
jgi:hypothetical protein